MAPSPYIVYRVQLLFRTCDVLIICVSLFYGKTLSVKTVDEIVILWSPNLTCPHMRGIYKSKLPSVSGRCSK